MTYDVAIIGSGPGGYVAAIRAAQLGFKVVCIEKEKQLGGTCLNVGCIPSKALLHSSELYWKLFHDYEPNGIEIKQPHYNFAQMMKRKEGIVSGFNQGIESLFKKHKIERIAAEAKLKSAREIDAGGKTIAAKYIILATGSEPIQLPFLPFDEKTILSSTGALALTKPPKDLLIIGAGVIGVELGSVYRRLGSNVTCIEFLDRICPAFDLAVSKALQKSLTEQGIVFHLSHKVTAYEKGELIVEGGEKSRFAADAILVAVGRRPYSKNLGLDVVGVKQDAKGFVEVDASFRTSVPNIFAIGDLINGPMLAHKASEEGVAVAELLAGQSPVVDYASIPNVAYTYPEVASVGFTEEELKQKGISYKVGQFPFKANSRARCVNETDGFVKILIESTSDTILGVHIIGAHASELIAEAALAIRLRATAHDLAQTCHAHPTLAEAIKEAALASLKCAIHA